MKSIIFSIDQRDGFIDSIIKSFIDHKSFNGHSLSSISLEKGDMFVKKFSDGEMIVDFKTSVRGNIVYLVTSPNTSDKIIALILSIDAIKRAAAKEINVILPYFPYSRQDKRDRARSPISAKVMSDMIQNAGATNVITFDLHAEQIEGFFNIPVTHMEGKYLFGPYISDMIKEPSTEAITSPWCLCSPDAGGAKRVKQVRDLLKNKFGLDIPYVLIDKTRSKANVVDDMVLIGNVQGMNVIIIDDLVDTGGTLCKAAKLLKEEGANQVQAIITHGVLSGSAISNIGASDLASLTISDSLVLNKMLSDEPMIEFYKGQEKIKVLTLAGQIAKAIFAINNCISVEELKQIINE